MATLPLATRLAWLLQALDVATGLLMIQARGPMAEANPLMRELYQSFGPLVMLDLKALVVWWLLRLFLPLGRVGRRRGALLVAGFGLVGAASNVATLFH